MSSPQKRAQLSDVLGTFEYAFESPYGQGSRNMYRMVMHSRDLGATLDESLQLLEDCNDYWESPMSQDRLEKLKEQCRRLY